jgi:molybdopterin-binding protein
MSYLIADVVEIQNSENINIVKFELESQTLTMISLDISADIYIGRKVKLLVNSSHVVIAKNLSGVLSYANQIRAKIETIREGKLLTHITLTFGESRLESIMIKESSLAMKLSVGDSVSVLIQASELSICEILDD